MSGGLKITDFLTLALWSILFLSVYKSGATLLYSSQLPILSTCILPAVCANRDYCSAKVRLRSAPVKAGPTVAVEKIFLAGARVFSP